MTAIENIPAPVLAKIKEYAFLQYNVTTVAELKAVIVEERFDEMMTDYLGEVMLRIMRKKKDEYAAYQPTEQELVDALQQKIDAATLPELSV